MEKPLVIFSEAALAHGKLERAAGRSPAAVHGALGGGGGGGVLQVVEVVGQYPIVDSLPVWSGGDHLNGWTGYRVIGIQRKVEVIQSLAGIPPVVPLKLDKPHELNTKPRKFPHVGSIIRVF